jgi:23S rRNA (cytosine1962-C5)-methyltransferase
MLPIARLSRDLGRSLRAGHPWVYRDALSLPAGLRPGDAIDLQDQRGKWLARGRYDESGPIGLRIWSLEPDEALDDNLLNRRVRSAAALRRAAGLPIHADAYRLIHGEADRMPGIICDIYRDRAILQLDAEGLSPLMPALEVAIRRQLPSLAGVALQAQREAGPERLLWLSGEAPAAPFLIQERGMQMEVDLEMGHKTGLYLDQRENRQRVGSLAAGRRVLNAFAYTGGFSLAAAMAGASSVCSIDQAAPAIEAARRNFVHNGLDPEASDYAFIAGDAFGFLEQAGPEFDLIILDPPSMAPSRASLDRALGAYRRLNTLALGRAAPGALLFSASCSSHVNAAALREVLAASARSAGRSLRIIEQRGPGPDHPVLPTFPEGDYLHAMLAFVD